MTTRRQFIKNVAIGTAAVSASKVAVFTYSASSYRNIVGANDSSHRVLA